MLDQRRQQWIATTDKCLFCFIKWTFFWKFAFKLLNNMEEYCIQDPKIITIKNRCQTLKIKKKKLNLKAKNEAALRNREKIVNVCYSNITVAINLICFLFNEHVFGWQK